MAEAGLFNDIDDRRVSLRWYVYMSRFEEFPGFV